MLPDVVMRSFLYPYAKLRMQSLSGRSLKAVGHERHYTWAGPFICVKRGEIQATNVQLS